jgi:broad specificity phosphatase PhoE
MVTVYMVRHGTTEYNLALRWQGEIDTELAPLGVEEAEREAAALADRVSFDAAYTSDLRRARRTCEILCAPHALTPVDAPALREPSLGPLEGMHIDDILREHGDLIDRLDAADHDRRLGMSYFDGLETPLDVAARVRRLVDDLAERHAGEVVLLVTHSIVLQSVLAAWAGDRYENIGMRQLAWIELTADGDGVTVRHREGFRSRSVRESQTGGR